MIIKEITGFPIFPGIQERAWVLWNKKWAALVFSMLTLEEEIFELIQYIINELDLNHCLIWSILIKWTNFYPFNLKVLSIDFPYFLFPFCLIAFSWNAKSFAIAILVFFLFFLLVTFSGQTGKSYFQNFVQLLLWARVTRIGVNNIICRVLSTHVL